jgi:hypothetical protein
MNKARVAARPESMRHMQVRKHNILVEHIISLLIILLYLYL